MFIFTYFYYFSQLQYYNIFQAVCVIRRDSEIKLGNGQWRPSSPAALTYKNRPNETFCKHPCTYLQCVICSEMVHRMWYQWLNWELKTVFVLVSCLSFFFQFIFKHCIQTPNDPQIAYRIIHVGLFKARMKSHQFNFCANIVSLK